MKIFKNSLAIFCMLMVSSVSWAAEGDVARAAFAAGIEDREPVGTFETATTEITPVYFFTELSQFQGEVVAHRWFYNDEQQAEVIFNVGGPRWRVYSSKTMLPEWTGEWTVRVVHNSEVVGEYQFNYVNASASTTESNTTESDTTGSE